MDISTNEENQRFQHPANVDQQPKMSAEKRKTIAQLHQLQFKLEENDDFYTKLRLLFTSNTVRLQKTFEGCHIPSDLQGILVDIDHFGIICVDCLDYSVFHLASKSKL